MLGFGGLLFLAILAALVLWVLRRHFAVDEIAPAPPGFPKTGRRREAEASVYDVVVVGGGPAGAPLTGVDAPPSDGAF